MLNGCTEETVFVVADIPAVPGCEVLTDCNTVVLSQYLNAAQREIAYEAWFTRWRKDGLRLVG